MQLKTSCRMSDVVEDQLSDVVEDQMSDIVEDQVIVYYCQCCLFSYSDPEEGVQPQTHEEIKLPSRINTHDSTSSSSLDEDEVRLTHSVFTFDIIFIDASIDDQPVFYDVIDLL